jgi:hypothetical protein
MRLKLGQPDVGRYRSLFDLPNANGDWQHMKCERL